MPRTVRQVTKHFFWKTVDAFFIDHLDTEVITVPVGFLLLELSDSKLAPERRAGHTDLYFFGFIRLKSDFETTFGSPFQRFGLW